MKKLAAILFLFPTLAFAQLILPLSASKWGIYWDNVPQPYNLFTGELAFDFAQHSSGLWDGYLLTGVGTKRAPAKLSGTMVITLACISAPSVVFRWDSESGNVGCPTPANARPIIYSGLKSLVKSGSDRWWAHSIAYTLTNGTATLTIPLTPGNWSNVNGVLDVNNPTGFQACLNSVSWVGMTFGGGCFYGHGVNVEGGNAQFIISDFRIVP